MAGATLRIRDEPFFITGRGVVIVCDFVAGTLYFGRVAATAAIPDGTGGDRVEPVDAIEAVLGKDRTERPGLLFRVERGEREVSLRALLKPGTLLTLTGPATEIHDVIVAMARLPADFHRGDVSPLELARRSGFAEHRDTIRVADIAAHVRAHPHLVDEWRMWSDDKRTTEGRFFFGRDWKLPWQGRWVVGYMTPRAEATNASEFGDPYEACAAFILRELGALTEPH